MTIDMHSGADRLAELVRAVPDGALHHPTPCSEYTVGDLLDHISGFAVGLAAAGRKDVDGMKLPVPGRAANLGEAWRTRIPAELAALAVGESFEVTGAELDVVDEFFVRFGPDERGPGYGPPVDSFADDRLSRIVATSGRDPHWRSGPT